MTGTVHVGGRDEPVSPLVAEGPRRLPLGPEGSGTLVLDGATGLALFFQLVVPVEVIGRRSAPDPLLVQAMLLACLLVGGTVAVSWVFAPRSYASDLAIQPERVARFLARKPEKKKEPQAARREDEAAIAKRLAEAPRPVPVVDRSPRPQTERERIVAKVANRGALKTLDQLTQRDSAVKSLFTRDTSAELTRSLDQLMSDRKVQAQAGGPGPTESTRGTAPGGGTMGVAFGQTYGGGKIDTSGADKVAARLASGKERKVTASVTAGGDATVDGGLAKEQIARVVRAHQAGIRYCYETELVRQPKLGGKIVVTWRIDLEGKVTSPRIASTTMNNTAVEACLVRQIARWHFPRPQGDVASVRYPFLFRGL
jgi:hypothetical protein